MRLKCSFCSSKNRIESELLQVPEVSHKSWRHASRLVIKRLQTFHTKFPYTYLQAPVMVLLRIYFLRMVFAQFHPGTYYVYIHPNKLGSICIAHNQSRHLYNLQIYNLHPNPQQRRTPAHTHAMNHLVQQQQSVRLLQNILVFLA